MWNMHSNHTSILVLKYNKALEMLLISVLKVHIRQNIIQNIKAEIHSILYQASVRLHFVDTVNIGDHHAT